MFCNSSNNIEKSQRNNACEHLGERRGTRLRRRAIRGRPDERCGVRGRGRGSRIFEPSNIAHTFPSACGSMGDRDSPANEQFCTELALPIAVDFHAAHRPARRGRPTMSMAGASLVDTHEVQTTDDSPPRRHGLQHQPVSELAGYLGRCHRAANVAGAHRGGESQGGAASFESEQIAVGQRKGLRIAQASVSESLVAAIGSQFRRTATDHR
jgi:hypothetical protein